MSDGPWSVTVKRLSSGYYHVRGEGPENWAQPPMWPCDEETLRLHAASGASERFIREALAAMERSRPDQSRSDVEARQALDELEIAAAAFHGADAELSQALRAALGAGVSAAEVARTAGLPYRKVLEWRRYV